jgi:hypothetical protein
MTKVLPVCQFIILPCPHCPPLHYFSYLLLLTVTISAALGEILPLPDHFLQLSLGEVVDKAVLFALKCYRFVTLVSAVLLSTPPPHLLRLLRSS